MTEEERNKASSLVRKRGAFQATVEFEGGHDQGNVTSIQLLWGDGRTEELPVWYSAGGYRINDSGVWEPVNPPVGEDEELSALLMMPVDEKFGSWGDISTTTGWAIWDFRSSRPSIVFYYEQETWQRFEEEF